MSERYQSYLQSEHWKGLKESKRKQSKRQTCPGCGQFKGNAKMHVHHMTYRGDPKNTKVKDLTLLCGNCHEVFHEAFGLQLPEELRSRGNPWLRVFTKKAIRMELWLRGKWPQHEAPACIRDWHFTELFHRYRKARRPVMREVEENV